MATPISQSLLAVKNKLITDNVFTSSECFISLEPHKIEYVGGVYAAITPGRISIDQDFVAGAGIYGGLINMTVNIRLWCMNALDESSRDTQALTDNTLGILTKLNSVIQSLQMYVYCDANSIGSFAEPMRLLSIDRPNRDATRPEWCNIDSAWEVRLQLYGGQ